MRSLSIYDRRHTRQTWKTPSQDTHGTFPLCERGISSGSSSNSFPPGCDCQTTVTVEINKQMAVGEDQHFQILKGRIGRIESSIDEGQWNRLGGKNVELYLFDPLRITLEGYTGINLEPLTLISIVDRQFAAAINDYYRRLNISLASSWKAQLTRSVLNLCSPRCSSPIASSLTIEVLCVL
jgi:hypothetical protein